MPREIARGGFPAEFDRPALWRSNGIFFGHQVWIQSDVCPCSQASLLTALAKNNLTGLFF